MAAGSERLRGNRIAGGHFTLDGESHQLMLNDGANAVHGGPGGFGKRWWAVEPLPPHADGSVALERTLASDDGDEHYPGRPDVTGRYTLTPANEWRIDAPQARQVPGADQLG